MSETKEIVCGKCAKRVERKSWEALRRIAAKDGWLWDQRKAEGGPLCKKCKTTVFVGTIPDIFGYGLMVWETSEAECRTALKRAFDMWDEQVRGSSRFASDFEEAFEAYGGFIVEVEKGRGYNDNFRD